MFSPHPSITFLEFRQNARRFKPSVFLPELAKLAIEAGTPPFESKTSVDTPPWGIAAAARESIIYGNEHRRGGVTAADARRIVWSIHLESANSSSGRDGATIQTQIAYEQFPYQESVWEEISRCQVLFVDGLKDGLKLEVLDEASLESILGASIQNTIGATFLLYSGAMANQGFYEESWLEQADLKRVVETWTREAIVATSSRLTATIEQFRADSTSAPKPSFGMERYGYNPLVKTPFVVLPDSRVLAPQPVFILRSISPAALYYPCIAQLGEGFSRDLGALVQHYVGKQLLLLGGELHPEIFYREGSDECRSVDWLLVLPELLVLVEVKSARLGVQAKAGEPVLDVEVNRSIGKAIKQLNRSYQNIRGKHVAFRDIPSDRPIVGLIVTAEPFYFANSPVVRASLIDADFPISVASLRELEQITCLEASSFVGLLSGVSVDQNLATWDLASVFREQVANGSVALRFERNPVLEEGWRRFHWPWDADCETTGLSEAELKA